MPEYIKKENDISFRRVAISASHVQNFEPFNQLHQVVNYNPNYVLEVTKRDNTTCLEYNAPKGRVLVGRQGTRDMWICKAIGSDGPELSTAHLWLRRVNSCVEYKIPDQLEVRDGKMLFTVPDGNGDVEVVGDKYFNAVFSIG